MIEFDTTLFCHAYYNMTEYAMTEYDRKYKVVVVGDSTVGKTSLLFRLKNERFNAMNQSTIGCEFFAHTVSLDKDYPGHTRNVKLLLWDTAGQEEFRSFTPNFLRGAAACLICYDLTNIDSFRHITGWLKDVHDTCTDAVPVALVGTKADLTEVRAVSKDEIVACAQKINTFTIKETSAKTGEGVFNLFKEVGQMLLDTDKTATIGTSSVRLITRHSPIYDLCRC